jgi:hypothetical protein
MWQKRVFHILLFFFGASLLLVLSLVYHYVHEKDQIEQTALAQVKQGAVYQINTKLQEQSAIELRHQQIGIVLCLIVFLVFFSALFFRADKGDSYRLWMVVFSASVLLLIGLGVVWFFAQQTLFEDKGTIIADKASLHHFLSANSKQSVSPKASPNEVPTGVFIESITFSNDNNDNSANLTGHIWQKYHDDTHKGIARGFILPQSSTMKIVEAYRHKENKTEMIGWFFEGSVPQQFDLSKYPLDKREISLLIHHKDIDKNIHLVPDLEAYTRFKPNALPGIKHDMIISGWHTMSSFFHYQTHRKDHFSKASKKHFFNLYFTVLLQRDLLKPFLFNVLPLIVVIFMLFVIQLFIGRMGVFANIVIPLAALFFGVILAHIELRREIIAPNILYFEYIYLTMYIDILSVAAGYFLFDTNKFLFIQYRDGLITKLLFLPLILGNILWLTIWIFHI